MLTKLQANSVIRKFTSEEQDSSPREWICSVDVIGKNDTLHVYVGSVIKNKYKKIYRTSNKGGVVGDFDNFNKAVSALIPDFISQVENKSFEICCMLAGHDLSFKGHSIKISKIGENGKVDFDFTDSGVNAASSSAEINVFAKNFVLGNINVK